VNVDPLSGDKLALNKNKILITYLFNNNYQNFIMKMHFVCKRNVKQKIKKEMEKIKKCNIKNYKFL
jgi:hypothetical protein